MRLVAITLTTGVLLAAGLPAVNGEAGSSCAATRARVVLRTESARVFHQSGVTFACLYSRGRRVALGPYHNSEYSTNYQRNLRLAGRYVALGQAILGKGLLSYTVNVFDLRGNRRVRITPTGATTPAAQSQTHGDAWGVGPTTDIELRATGQVAWIAQDVYTPGPTTYEVHKREGRMTTKLAEGTDIEPASLGLRGNRLTWRQAGQPQTRTLGPAPR